MGYALFKMPGPRSEMTRGRQRQLATQVADAVSKVAGYDVDYGCAYRKFIYVEFRDPPTRASLPRVAINHGLCLIKVFER